MAPFNRVELVAAAESNRRIHASSGGLVGSDGALSIRLNLPSNSCPNTGDAFSLVAIHADTLLDEVEVMCSNE